MNISIQHRLCFKILILAFLGISVPSWSGVFAPDWRGDEKSVYAEWDTWIYRTTYPGDFIFTADNTGFGLGIRKAVTPQAVQMASQISGSAAEIFNVYNGHAGVLKLNGEGFYVNLPNFFDGEEYTRVRFEICYNDTYASFADIQVFGLTDTGTVPGYDGVFINPMRVQDTRNGAWITEVYEFVIQPSPLWETVFIQFDHYPDTSQGVDAPYIDYLAFDTICIPEPASVLFLALGALFLRRSGR